MISGDVRRGGGHLRPEAAGRGLSRPVSARSELPRLILSTAPGRVRLVAGIGARELFSVLDAADGADESRLALFVRPKRAAASEALIEELLERLAAVALRLWPVWWGNVDFSDLRGDALGREAARLRLRSASRKIPQLSLAWAQAATDLAMAGGPPRLKELHWKIQLAQLCLAIDRKGLVLIFEDAGFAERAGSSAFIQTLEMIAGETGAGIVLLCPVLPPFAPPYDRVLADAVQLEQPAQSGAPADSPDVEDWDEDCDPSLLLAPIRGRPHPLSDVEGKMARSLAADRELRGLFHHNCVIETLRGSRPRVDLVWLEGRLIVELDGYVDHGRRESFANDRHRDYELMHSGYAVLRLTNDEVLQDVAKAVDKIRDIVKLQRLRINGSSQL